MIRPLTTDPAAGALKRPGRRADAAHVAVSTPDAYAEHLPALTRYCRSLVGDDAEDVAQEVMLKALAERPAPATAAPWLFRVAHNTSISLLRTRKRRAAEPIDDLPLATTHDVEQTSAIKGRLAELLDDLAALPERQRQALLLRELDGLSAKAIGRALDITETAAQQAVLDARRSLAHCEEGRALACDGVQRWLSDHDWTRLRTRRVRAHLRDCGTCTTFAERIGTRPGDLRQLFPHGGLLELLAKLVAGGAGTAKLAAGLAGVAVVTGTATQVVPRAPAPTERKTQEERVAAAPVAARAPVRGAVPAPTTPRRTTTTRRTTPTATGDRPTTAQRRSQAVTDGATAAGPTRVAPARDVTAAASQPQAQPTSDGPTPRDDRAPRTDAPTSSAPPAPTGDQAPAPAPAAPAPATPKLAPELPATVDRVTTEVQQAVTTVTDTAQQVTDQTTKAVGGTVQQLLP